MALRWAITGGSWSDITTWNDGATLGIPTVGDDVYSNGFTVLVNTGFTVNTLNNTARTRDIATPQMTSNNVPNPYVAASSSVFSSELPFLAFDRNTGTNFGTAGQTGWLSMDFGSGNSIVIDGYTIRGTGQQIYNIRNWTLEGSNNNSTWVILHTVTGATAIPANSTYSVSSIGNTTGYRYYRINISANGSGPETSRIVELELNQPGTIALVAGGNFNFNTSNITANLSGALNLSSLVVNSTGGGTITINAPNSYIPLTVNGLLHSGTANLVFNSLGNVSLGINAGSQVVHTSSGNLTLGGTLYQHQTFSAGGTNRTIDSSGTGSIIINGNLEGQISGRGGEIAIIKTSSGGITITGNVSCRGNITIQSTTISGLTIGGNLQNNSNSGNAQIILGSPTVTVSGNVSNGGTALFQSTGGVINVGGNVTNTSTTNATISTNFTTINVNGNASTTNAGAAVSSTISSTINILGNASASTNQNAVFVTNSTAQVYLRGNMFNVNGKMGIYAPIIWLDQTGTTQARFFTSGGSDRTLYSDNTFPTQPPLSDVRYLTQFGPSSGLTGTLRMATPTDVRSGVATDNTVGTALFDTSQLLAELNASSDPIAQRLRIAATPEILGQLIAAYKR